MALSVRMKYLLSLARSDDILETLRECVKYEHIDNTVVSALFVTSADARNLIFADIAKDAGARLPGCVANDFEELCPWIDAIAPDRGLSFMSRIRIWRGFCLANIVCVGADFDCEMVANIDIIDFRRKLHARIKKRQANKDSALIASAFVATFIGLVLLVLFMWSV